MQTMSVDADSSLTALLSEGPRQVASKQSAWSAIEGGADDDDNGSANKEDDEDDLSIMSMTDDEEEEEKPPCR